MARTPASITDAMHGYPSPRSLLSYPTNHPDEECCATPYCAANARVSRTLSGAIIVRMSANIGVVGLAVMGLNLARNLASREGNTVAVYNRSREKTDTLVTEHPEAGLIPAFSYEEFAASLSKPRTAIIMVKAGRGTDAVIDELVRVFETGRHHRRRRQRLLPGHHPPREGGP